MHPVAVIAIVAGGIFVLWGGYEAVNTLYEWHQDRKEQREYEEYVRMHNEKSQYVPVPLFNNEDDEEEDDDNEPLGIWKQKRDSLQSSELRQRKPNNTIDQEEPLPNYEFSEMERSISNRKSLLQRETEQLIKEEAELQRSRELLRSKGNSITGVIHDEKEDANPFSDDFFIERSATPSPTLPPTAADKSDSSWSDLDQDKPSDSASDSAESFESIHHNQL